MIFVGVIRKHRMESVFFVIKYYRRRWVKMSGFCVKCEKETDFLNSKGYCKKCEIEFFLSKKKLNLDVCFDYPHKGLVEKKVVVKKVVLDYWKFNLVKSLFGSQYSFRSWYGRHKTEFNNLEELVCRRKLQLKVVD